jgi:hypothetical protein
MMFELLVIIIIVSCNIYVRSLDLKTDYSKTQAEWVFNSLQEIVILSGGLLFYKVVAIVDNQLTTSKVIFFILWTLFWIRMCFLYFEGRRVNAE